MGLWMVERSVVWHANNNSTKKDWTQRLQSLITKPCLCETCFRIETRLSRSNHASVTWFNEGKTFFTFQLDYIHCYGVLNKIRAGISISGSDGMRQPQVRIPCTTCSLFLNCGVKRTKLNKKRPRLAHILKSSWHHSTESMTFWVVEWVVLCNQCDQIGQFMGLWATF